MRRIGIWLLLSCNLAAFSSLAGVGQESKKAFEHTPSEEKVFELTNLERKKKDLPPLKLNPALSKIARKHSDNMAAQQKMEHKLDNKTPGDRTRSAGYKFSTVGENIGEGEGEFTLEMLMKAWMDSDAHRKNILLPAYTEIGVGIARDKEGKLYFTQLFARPRAE